jgi:hypothetical protein
MGFTRMANGSSFVKSGPYGRRAMQNPALCSNDARDLEEVRSSLRAAVGVDEVQDLIA